MTVNVESDEDLAKRFEEAALGYARDRNMCALVLLEFGSAKRLMRIEEGKVIFVTSTMPINPPWNFAIRGTSAAWKNLWEPMPKPGWHDIMALATQEQMRFEGNIQPMMAHLQYIKDLLATPRKKEARS
jgi:hypothetical protein